MLEVRCNGKIYLIPKNSGIADELAEKAVEVRDDAQPASNHVVYTHDEAARIVEQFEDLLCANNIKIACADPDEEADRGEDNGAALYGTEYSNLLDGVEDALTDMLGKAGVTNFVSDEFSGEY